MTYNAYNGSQFAPKGNMPSMGSVRPSIAPNFNPAYNPYGGYGGYGYNQFMPNQQPNLTQLANSFMEQPNQQMYQQPQPQQTQSQSQTPSLDIGCKFVNSYSEVQSFPVIAGTQTMLMNMNEDEFYIKTKSEGGKDLIRIFTFSEKDKPKEIASKEQDKQTIDTLVEQMAIVQKKLDDMAASLLNRKLEVASAANSPATAQTAPKINDEKPIYNGGK